MIALFFITLLRVQNQASDTHTHRHTHTQRHTLMKIKQLKRHKYSVWFSQEC